MISHHHQCIFIHVPKNAGQSVETVFLDLLGLTWETRAPLLLRSNSNSQLGPPRLAHLKAKDYVQCKYLPQDMFDQYFKFAFVRNPWDRMVSIYKYSGFRAECDFKTFLLKYFKAGMFRYKYWLVGPQSEFLYDEEGKCLVNFVGKFENLQQDFEEVCQQINLPVMPLPHVNKSKTQENVELSARLKTIVRCAGFSGVLDYGLTKLSLKSTPQFKRYQDYYDNETQDFVADLYQSDISYFGYTFQ